MGRDHRLGRVARVVAEHFGQLRIEPRGAGGFGFVFWSGKVVDQTVQNGLRQWVDDQFAGRSGGASVGVGGPGENGHWNGRPLGLKGEFDIRRLDDETFEASVSAYRGVAGLEPAMT